jgi:S1-C subfamily serine protease
MMRALHYFCTIFVLFATVACNTTSSMQVPEVTASQQIKVTKPVEEQASFALSKVIASIKRGTTIVHFPARGLTDLGVKGSLCNAGYTGKATMDWGAGTSDLGDWRNELGEIFYEALADKALNVAGDPRDLFGNKDAVNSAEYRVGAIINEIKGNACHSHHWYYGTPEYEHSGEMFVEVEWAIFDNLRKQQVLKTKTQGYFKQVETRKDGILLMFHEAFARATENLMTKPDFIALATRQSSPKDRASKTGPRIVFSSPKIRDKALERDIKDLLPAVVTIRRGTGHGSGFAISSDGLILTNAHVVGDAKRVAIILNNGVEVEGTVERSNRNRDVALVKVPLRVPNALPLRLGLVRTLEKVYAVGSPLEESLKSTVTTGIVSAIRKSKKTGFVTIQSDAAVSGGNSGGPLLDNFGNVVGISVASLIGQSAQNLNLFIPIADALKSLNLEIERTRKSAGS